MRKASGGVGVGLRLVAGAVLASAVFGCTSVKLVQREDCWVRRTEKWYGAVNEELGPCARAAPKWVQDRHTRLVQECVAQADYRWQTKALEAFSRGAPWPEQTGQEQVLKLCMEEAARAYIVENDELKNRLSEAKDEREALKSALARNDEHLRSSHDRLAEALGEAAIKPPGTATATATSSSEGKAATEATESESPAAAPAITWVSTSGGPACGLPQVDQARTSRKVAAAETTERTPKKPKVVSREVKKAPAAPLCAPAPAAAPGTATPPPPEQKPTASAELARAGVPSAAQDAKPDAPAAAPVPAAP